MINMSSQLTNVWHVFDVTAGDDGVTCGDSTVVSKGNGMCPSIQHLEIGCVAFDAQREMSEHVKVQSHWHSRCLLWYLSDTCTCLEIFTSLVCKQARNVI